MIHWRELKTDEKIEAIKGVWIPGTSASELAAKLGKISRNAVIGMYTRHRPKLEEFPLLPYRQTGSWPKKARGARKPVAAKAMPPVIVAQPLPKPEPMEGEFQGPGIPLMMLGVSHCKWPVNDVERGGTFLFCGHERDSGPYCQHHASRSVQSDRSTR